MFGKPDLQLCFGIDNLVKDVVPQKVLNTKRLKVDEKTEIFYNKMKVATSNIEIISKKY